MWRLRVWVWCRRGISISSNSALHLPGPETTRDAVIRCGQVAALGSWVLARPTTKPPYFFGRDSAEKAKLTLRILDAVEIFGSKGGWRPRCPVGNKIRWGNVWVGDQYMRSSGSSPEGSIYSRMRVCRWCVQMDGGGGLTHRISTDWCGDP